MGSGPDKSRTFSLGSVTVDLTRSEQWTRHNQKRSKILTRNIYKQTTMCKYNISTDLQTTPLSLGPWQGSPNHKTTPPPEGLYPDSVHDHLLLISRRKQRHLGEESLRRQILINNIIRD